MAPPQLPGEKDHLSVIDRILEKMALGNVAFNAPRSMTLENSSIIQLMLGLSMTTEELKQRIEAEGEKEGASIRVSESMEARLSGPNFHITAITPEIQAVSRNEITEWKWEVKPISEGLQHLHLTLSAFINVNGTSTPRAIRTFDKIIEVEVTWPQKVGTFFKENWQWLWAAILTPIAGWLWTRRKESKTKTNHSDS